ncbi:hypothetical protein YW3DRAFT_07368 [Streptomyces sp. MnatMP-M77]|nr:hypothetical protein YW3DRAFT_07368 [Streptomyces sp. MnatMP-M77]
MARELVLICWDCRREMVRDDGYLWAHTGRRAWALLAVLEEPGPTVTALA